MATYYMLVYCNDGPDTPTKFLIGRRNKEGYFFHNKQQYGGEAIPRKPQEFSPSQTPEKLVLPGGTPDSSSGDPFNLANTEFIEETGVDLLNSYDIQDVYVQTINDYRRQPAAYIVQVKLINGIFQTLVNQISRNMDDKKIKVDAIKDRPYQQTMPECAILDDELSGVEVLETGTPEFNTALLEMDTKDPNARYKYRGWFAEGIVNCVNRIYDLQLDTTFNSISNVNGCVHDAIFRLNQILNRRPHESAERRPYESADRHPHEPADRRPHESADRRSHESAEHRPHESAERRSHESAEHRPHESAERRRHVIDERRRRNERRRRERSRRERSRSRSPRR
ncbi:hypothetical protein [Vallitalea maricola]|uniref:Uncharacterized protein n=1 Tax=Vallitalea maricola TaxID=3074433 RepID=A0ACB5UNQ7_9FIRM|nr:hypothetical protein AN2V17_34120 [Vallitalea sp. AN17-2]